MSEVCIVGVGDTPCGSLPERTELQLHHEAAAAALRDAGIGPREVDGLFTCGSDPMQPVAVGEYLGLTPSYLDGTQIGGASWGAFVGHACAALASGRCRVALLVYGSTARSDLRRPRPARSAPPHGPGQYEAPYGVTLTAKYALAARRHMHEYGTTARQLAEVAAAANAWAQLNPAAFHHGQPLTVEAAMASPIVADPLRRADCCLRTDGGGAVVLATADRARDARHPIRVLGTGEAHAHHDPLEWPDIAYAAARESGARAFRMAGLGPGDVDVVQVSDAFTITVLLSLEALGFCAPGASGPLAEHGGLAPGGRLAVNTDGGGLAANQPGMRGVFQLIEAARQLRGECGARQIPDAAVALCNGTGGFLASSATVILGR